MRKKHVPELIFVGGSACFLGFDHHRKISCFLSYFSTRARMGRELCVTYNKIGNHIFRLFIGNKKALALRYSARRGLSGTLKHASGIGMGLVGQKGFTFKVNSRGTRKSEILHETPNPLKPISPKSTYLPTPNLVHFAVKS